MYYKSSNHSRVFSIEMKLFRKKILFLEHLIKMKMNVNYMKFLEQELKHFEIILILDGISIQ